MDQVFPQDFLLNHEKYDVQFNYEEDPCEFLFHTYNDTAAIAPPVQNFATTFDQDFIWQPQKFSERPGLQYPEDGREDLLDSSVICSDKKKMASYRKEENRKINTAQGPRDRRVRFSTEIAHKFFGLQDLLGFDRASKTLNWLFNNSVTAIKELVEEKSHNSSCRSSVKFLETIINGGGSDENVNGGKKKSVVVECADGKKTKTKRKLEAESFRVMDNVARDQSRAAARARARERTREKMRVKKLDHDSNPSLLKSGGCWSKIEPKSDYKNTRCECIIDPETTSRQLNDSSSLCNSFYQNLEHYFHD